MNIKIPGPSEGIRPTHYSDMLGQLYTKEVTKEHKKNNGQFFTPVPIAERMAHYCTATTTAIKILDPGCGVGVLSCSLLEHLSTSNLVLREVELVLYEIDDDVLPYLEASLNYLHSWLENKGIALKYEIRTEDFILANLQAAKYEGRYFDVIISNPPYFKLASDDVRVKSTKQLFGAHSNIYSLFMAVSARLLREQGQLIFITPRSFASGRYFKEFRHNFFNMVSLNNIHLFVSRSKTFGRDEVLQETLILVARKQNHNPESTVEISSSEGINDIFQPRLLLFQDKEIIDRSCDEMVLHLPSNERDRTILNLVSGWKDRLADFNISISTGPVVAYRAKDCILEKLQDSAVQSAPLFWLHNVQKMRLSWPVELQGKGQYIVISQESRSQLIPNKNYIFLRRFSTKDDKSRLIATPYQCRSSASSLIGVENKLNYIYRKGGELKQSEIMGLCALLNSSLFDAYFQMFNGNVNVSATELRTMNFPTLEVINEIGDELISGGDYSQTTIDLLIEQKFNLQHFIYAQN